MLHSKTLFFVIVMMASQESHSIEQELQDIDEEFTSGRMNAFGDRASQEDIFKEVRKISELQVLRHSKMSNLLKPCSEDDLIDSAGDVSELESALDTLATSMQNKEAIFRSITESLRQTVRHTNNINDIVQRAHTANDFQNETNSQWPQ